MGAWIEIDKETDTTDQKKRSHPLWVRGLKSLFTLYDNSNSVVAPFMGAWIEISMVSKVPKYLFCRTLYGCVDWNDGDLIFLRKTSESHPLWVRGLKYTQCREAKGKATCRILYGCVNWNKSLKYKWCF